MRKEIARRRDDKRYLGKFGDMLNLGYKKALSSRKPGSMAWR